MSKTPRISRTWRALRRGRIARLLRLEREADARRAPDRDELRDVVRRMLRALEPIGFYPFAGRILSGVAVAPFAEGEIRYGLWFDESRTRSLPPREFRFSVHALELL